MTMAEELAANPADVAVMLGGQRSETLAQALEFRRMSVRELGDRSAHIVLHDLAENEARALLGRLCVIAERGQVAGALYTHLTLKDLTSVIYRHAMIHAGMVGPKEPGGGGGFHPYDKCPVCGKNL